jgi:general secretion pathway protein C
MHPTGMNRLTQWILYEAWIVALELALVAALAISLAYWTWAAVSPAVVAAPSSSTGAEAARSEQIASQNLFGAASQGATTSARGASAGITLLGVFSGSRAGEGRAILVRQGARPATVAAGESIAEGIMLREVHPDYVIVLHDGVPERVDLERRALRAAPTPAGAPSPVRK